MQNETHDETGMKKKLEKTLAILMQEPHAIDNIKNSIIEALKRDYDITMADPNFLDPDGYAATVRDIAVMEDEFANLIEKGDEIPQERIDAYINANENMCLTSYICEHIGLDDVCSVSFIQGIYSFLTGESIEGMDINEISFDTVANAGSVVNSRRKDIIRHFKNTLPSFENTVLFVYVNEDDE